MRKNQFLPLLLLALLWGCKDEEVSKGAYEHGVIIVNEGNFTEADGSLSYFDRDSKATALNIFSRANNGAILGDVVQSVCVNGDVAYILINNSNKVEVVNIHTLERITSFEADLPRYMVISSGKGFVTVWGKDFNKPQVLIVDLASHQVINAIDTDPGPEQIVAASSKIYVANSWSNTVTVMDAGTNQILSTITTEYYGIAGLAVDNKDNVWGIHPGSFDFVSGTPNLDGALVKIDRDTDAIDVSIALQQNVSSRIAMNRQGNRLYYMNSKEVFEVNLDDQNHITRLIVEPDAIQFYGIGVDPVTDAIYVSDAKGFQGNGSVFRYEQNGVAIDRFTVGRGPNGFVFK